MIREAWEQNYQLSRTIHWEAEDIPWQEVVATATRKASDSNGLLFALVIRRPLRTETRREEITVYKTASGRMVQDPSQSPGEGFYPHIQTRSVNTPLYSYTAWFFSRSRQPSGILAAEVPRNGPCKAFRDTGTRVWAVGKNTPAHKADLHSGDVITAINGRTAPYSSFFSLLQPGENSLMICRQGQRHAAALTLPAPKINERK